MFSEQTSSHQKTGQLKYFIGTQQNYEAEQFKYFSW